MVIKIGHRGAKGYEPENTLRSFKKALELNVDMVELDVRVCKTGEVVVIHDEKVDRTTNGRGYVNKKTFDELRNLDAGKGERIPTLQEALNLISKKKGVYIELKSKETIKPVFDLIMYYVKDKRRSYDDFLIASFDYDWLLKFSKLNVKIGLLIDKKSKNYLDFAKKVGAYSLNFSSELVNKDIVDGVHKEGMKIFVWTVNDKEGIQRMKEIGVDGIVSDFPDMINGQDNQ